MKFKTLKELNDKFLIEHYTYSQELKILNLIHLFYWLEKHPLLKRKVKLREIESLIRVKVAMIEFSN